MFKSKLQEFCQRKCWELPEYTTVREGPQHMPHFTGTVKVHGQIFETPEKCKSRKEAQNTAAQIALEYLISLPPPAQFQANPHPTIHPPAPSGNMNLAVDAALPLSPLPSSLPNPPLGFLAPKGNANTNSALPITGDGSHTSVVHKMAIGSRDKIFKDTSHICKSRLQQYAQKHNLGSPVYTNDVEGPPHACRFKSRVSLNGKSYETIEVFPTLKEAEQIAAKIACEMLSIDGIEEDAGLYKNLLQDFAQKQGLQCPSYDTVSTGLSHLPSFVSTVKIGNDTFKGTECKTKKQAERNAAKVAYCSLTQVWSAAESSKAPSLREHVAENLKQDTHPIVTTKTHHAVATKGSPPTNSQPDDSEFGADIPISAKN